MSSIAWISGFRTPAPGATSTQRRGWETETSGGVARLAEYGADGGRRNAFVRVPDRRAVVIVLTNDDQADAKGMANRILDRLLSPAAGTHQ
jgi:hypothetical protein